LECFEIFTGTLLRFKNNTRKGKVKVATHREHTFIPKAELLAGFHVTPANPWSNGQAA